MIVFFIWLVVLPAFFLYFGSRAVRALENRPRTVPDDSISRRITQLEDAVGRIDTELVRLAEDQRFVTRLLTERHERSQPALPEEHRS